MSTPLYPILCPAEELPGLLRSSGQAILGLIGFGKAKIPAAAPCPSFVLPLPVLGVPQYYEVWHGQPPVQSGQNGAITYAANEQVLFGGLSLSIPDGHCTEVIAYQGYRDLLELIHKLGYPHLLRIWNYFPAINGEYLGLECYKRFCLGRHQAFAEHDYDFTRDLPAATAIGSDEKSLQIYFFASQGAGRNIENPRQISAYHYPLEYGPRSPSFSRATLKDFGTEQQLYISGTSSIVGHQSMHAGNVENQLCETLNNLEAVLQHAALGGEDCKLADPTGNILIKVYLRHPQHFSIVAARLSDYFGQSTPIVYLRGDICRQDLLLEIEAVIRYKKSFR